MRPKAHPLAVATTLAFAIVILPMLGWAQGSETRLDLHIPAQDLRSSLRAVARYFRCNIIFSEEDVRGRVAPPLQGTYSAASAYEALLKDTLLIADLSERGTVVIRPRERLKGKPLTGIREPTSTVQTVLVTAGRTGTEGSMPEPTSTAETAVLTGRAGVESRTRAESSYSISVVPEERVRESGASSVADSIRMVPGFWVENSGGEASANVRARGIPVDGFASVQVEEDGLPIQHDPALGYLSADQSFRLDETIREIQVVRGGPSSVFSSNAPGGLINYITRKPGSEAQGVLKLTVGDDGLYRTDVWLGGPLWDGWRAAFGGFYRIERGVRDPGYDFNKGGQFHVSASHDVGAGTLDVDYKRVDDRVGFYTDIPVQVAGNSVHSIAGLNANTGILAGPETESLVVRTPNGLSTLNLADGTTVRLDQATAHLVQEAGPWHIENTLRVRATDQVRVGLFPSSVEMGSLAANDLLLFVHSLFPNVSSLQFRYADSPNTGFGIKENGNGLEVDAFLRQVSISEQELIDDLRFSRKFSIGGQTHDVSLGLYIMSGHEIFTLHTAEVFLDVTNHARLLNLVGFDSYGGMVGILTQNGVASDGAEFSHGQGGQETRALYAADEWQLNDFLRLDIGYRAEMMHTSGVSEGTEFLNLDQTLSGTAYSTGNGVFTPFDRTFSAQTWTIGANWQLSPNRGFFARITAAARLPSINDFIIDATNNPAVNRTEMYELGIKFDAPRLEAYATLFDTEYHDYEVTQEVIDSTKLGINLENYYAGTRDYGIELEGSYRVAEHFDLDFGATLQHPVYTSLQYTPLANQPAVDYDGNQLVRIPKVSVSASPAVQLFDNRLRVRVSAEYYGTRYADEANQQRLPPYTVVSADARLRLSPALTLYINGYNLFNTIGLTEGAPDISNISTSRAGAQVYLARPILGRSGKLSLLYAF
jgi:outer membrane receptor protein involved in Fe transport